MKTPEDEAFEDIERRQGGGFPAKRAMAADKQREWVGLTDEELADYLGNEYHNMTTSELRFFRLGEAAAKEKNT
jgi:hypothetical protein